MKRLGINETYANITARNGELNAYLSVVPVDRLVSSEGPLAGVTLGVKDNIAVAGLPLTCGSRFLEHYVAPYTATVVERLVAAGAVVVGKLNLDEFAMGSANTYSAYGPARNPWDTERVPGGSSGGSAAAVAAKMCDAALGSDTGGSVRQPAAYCGVYGYKPTYGVFSRYGLTAFASSLDQIGILARQPEQIRELARIAAGRDEHDATSIEPPSFDPVIASPRGVRIGVIKEYEEKVGPAVAAAYERVVAALRSAGATIVPLSFPEYETVISVYQVIATAEASTNLARFDGIRYTERVVEPCSFRDLIARSRGRFFGAEVKRRILLGTWVLSRAYYDSYYLRAAKVRTLIFEQWRRFFTECDAVLSPVTSDVAFRLDAVPDPFSLYLEDLFTIPANLTGMPALAFPAAVHESLPIGLQFTADRGRDALLFDLATWFERNVFDFSAVERGCRHDAV